MLLNDFFVLSFSIKLMNYCRRIFSKQQVKFYQADKNDISI